MLKITATTLGTYCFHLGPRRRWLHGNTKNQSGEYKIILVCETIREQWRQERLDELNELQREETSVSELSPGRSGCRESRRL